MQMKKKLIGIGVPDFLKISNIENFQALTSNVLSDTSNFNLAQFLLAKQKKIGNRTALIVVDEVGKKRTVSYQALDEKVRMAACQIKALNFPKQAVIALQSDKVEEFLVFFLALNWLGLVPVPLILSLNKNELEFILQDCQAEAFLCFRREESAISLPHHCRKISRMMLPSVNDLNSLTNIVITKKEDPAFIFYTSGSSGLPKGVVHAQRVILGRLPSLENWLTLNESDIVMQTDNLCWTYSMFTGFLDPLFVGATAVIIEHSHLSSLAENEMTAEAWFKIIKDCQVTVMASTPDIYCTLLAAKKFDLADCSSLRQAGCAGAFLKKEVQADWVAHFGFPIFIALGMSEISTFISTGPKVAYRSQALGKIQPGRKVTILPVNEQGHSPGCGEQGILAVHKTELGLMLNYAGTSAGDKAHWRGDWFLTQDKVSYDDEQYIYYHGRIDNIVKVGGGFRVSPLAIEEEIKQFSDIDNAVCDVIYEEKTGSDQLIAYLVSSKMDPSALLELYEYLKNHLSDYELPLYFYYVEKFPLTSRGKIARYKISESRIIKKYRVVEGRIQAF